MLRIMKSLDVWYKPDGLSMIGGKGFYLEVLKSMNESFGGTSFDEEKTLKQIDDLIDEMIHKGQYQTQVLGGTLNIKPYWEDEEKDLD